MKKILTSLFVFIFIFSNTTAFAQMPVAAPGVVSSLEGLSRIGVVAAIQGKVKVMTPGAAGRVVQSGEEIFIGDEVKTDALGHLQILLLDQTVFTIGPNSAIIIDKFIYDPGTHVGKMEASVTKGVFRYVSGKIAANKPENVTIKLPTATIGIRGTIIAGEVSATGSMAMLMGPGAKNETGATIGSFVMSGTGENSGEQEHVTRTGFGVSVDQAGSLSGVFLVPDAQVNHLSAALLPVQRADSGNDRGPRDGPGRVPKTGPGAPGPKTDPGAPDPKTDPGAPDPKTDPGAPDPKTGPRAPAPGLGPVSTMGGAAAGGMPATGTVAPPVMATGVFGADFNAGQASGAQTYSDFQTTQQANIMGMLQTNLNQDTTLASQDALHNTAVQPPPQAVRDTLNRDMRDRVAPIVTYQHTSGVFNFGALQGTLNVIIAVDFGSNMVIGSASHIQIDVPDAISPGTSLVDGCILRDQPFNTNPANLTDLATFQWTNGAVLPTQGITQQGSPNFDSAGIFNQVTVQFQDVLKTAADGSTQVDLAAQAKVTVDYTRPNTPTPDIGTGEVIVPEVAVPTP